MISTRIQSGPESADLPSWWDAVVLGVVEGVTEFLPISSTGHLIVAQRALGYSAGDTSNAFNIVIQIGAITAILALYWRRLFAAAAALRGGSGRGPNLIWQIVIAAGPVALLGLTLRGWLHEALFSPRVVAGALVLGGLLLLLLERYLRRRPAAGVEIAEMTYRTALLIGLWQCLALVPGTSRSGATIAGALVLGMRRTAAAEFSFLVGLPILYGASFFELYTLRESLHGGLLTPLFIAAGVAFLAALVVVKPFVAFLARHDFRVFAYYRIAAGAVIFAMIFSGFLPDA